MGYTIEKNSKNLSDLFIKDQSDPFFSYEFLNSLEKNNCLDEDSGWSANYFHQKIFLNPEVPLSLYHRHRHKFYYLQQV